MHIQFQYSGRVSRAICCVQILIRAAASPTTQGTEDKQTKKRIHCLFLIFENIILEPQMGSSAKWDYARKAKPGIWI